MTHNLSVSGELADVISFGQCAVRCQTQYCAAPVVYSSNPPAGIKRPASTFVNYVYYKYYTVLSVLFGTALVSGAKGFSGNIKCVELI